VYRILFKLYKLQKSKKYLFSQLKLLMKWERQLLIFMQL